MDDLAIAVFSYNAIIIGIVGLIVYWYAQRPHWGRFLAGACVVLIASLVVAVLAAAPGMLRAARLVCFGWFLHFSIYLLAVILCSWRPRRRLSMTAAALLLASAAVSADCFIIEPYWLEITHTQLRSPRVTRPLRVAVVADFQTDEFGQYQRESLLALMNERPDAIVMAGDYLQCASQSQWEQLRDEMRCYLQEIGFSAPLGVYAVGGNTDFQRWPEIFEGLPVTVFRGTETIELDELCVTGLSVPDSFRTDLCIPRSDRFHIVLGHAPNFALGHVEADLLAAGHTHGGQVRLPWIGPLVTLSEVPRSWAAGLTQLDEFRTLAVARGVGMERHDAPRLRFLCRPQLLIIDVLPISLDGSST